MHSQQLVAANKHPIPIILVASQIQCQAQASVVQLIKLPTCCPVL